MPDVITATEYLEISSTPLATPAWRITDLTPLKEPPDQRGVDWLIPGTGGIKPLQRRNTVTVKRLPMFIYGGRDRTNAAITNGLDGLQDNIDALYTAIVAPVGSGDGTRAATWHLPDGSTTRTANVHVLELRLNRVAPLLCRAVLVISIPTGRFA